MNSRPEETRDGKRWNYMAYVCNRQRILNVEFKEGRLQLIDRDRKRESNKLHITVQVLAIKILIKLARMKLAEQLQILCVNRQIFIKQLLSEFMNLGKIERNNE